MTEIGSGGNYRFAVDPTKNRLYAWFFGDFMRAEDNPHLVEHAEQACKRLKPGFTMLTDFLEVKMVGLPDLTQRVQAVLLSYGVSKVAAVWSRESFSKHVIDSSAQKVGDAYAEKRRSFISLSDGEAWLDE